MQEVLQDESTGKCFVEDTIEDLVPHIKKSLEDPNVKFVKVFKAVTPVTNEESFTVEEQKTSPLDELIEKCEEEDDKNFKPGICLTIREAKILCLRAKKKTLYEIAKMFKVTAERIRQIEARAIRKLERGIKAQEEKDELTEEEEKQREQDQIKCNEEKEPSEEEKQRAEERMRKEEDKKE